MLSTHCVLLNVHFSRQQSGWSCYTVNVYRMARCPDITMMTSSSGNVFRVTGPLCREFTGHRWILLTKASDGELRCFLRLSKRLSTQSRRHWFETPSRTLWCHCNDIFWSHQKHPHGLGCQNRRHIFRILDNDRCQTSQYDIKNFTCANWNTICSMQNFALTCLIWISSYCKNSEWFWTMVYVGYFGVSLMFLK